MAEKPSETFVNSNEEPNKKADKNGGFDLFPERRDDKKFNSLWNRYEWLDNRMESMRSHECENNVVNVVKNDPLVKLFLQALKKSGCPIDLRRHIVCENCDDRVTGGYDQELNQIVICKNSKKARSMPNVILVHELTHMFDHCVGDVNYENLDHLACSEIRAANIAHCSFISSLLLLQSTPINIKKTHQYCVKLKAAQSMMVVRKISFETAMKHISNVFDKCYNDLEPIGRRIMRNSNDPQLAYSEGVSFGYGV